MRPRIYLPLIFILVLIVYFVVRLLGFLQIFFEHTGIRITQEEAKAAHLAQTPDTREQLIPKKIHQIYHDWSGNNTSIPSDWDAVRHTCINSNPDWEYTLWTTQSSRDFIEKEYPWFLSTYDGYKIPIQRVDTARYFIIRHFGGIYIDLDNGCLESLEPLLYYPTWIIDGGRGALSNNVIASSVQHPFWQLLTESLIPYNYNYLFPYVTISYASGQWFETAIWDKYHHSLPKGDDGKPIGMAYRLLMDNRPGFDHWIFFTQERGETWVNWDNLMFHWIGDHLILEAFILCGLIVLVCWSVRRCIWSQGGKRKDKEGYRRLSGSRATEDAYGV